MPDEPSSFSSYRRTWRRSRAHLQGESALPFRRTKNRTSTCTQGLFRTTMSGNVRGSCHQFELTNDPYIYGQLHVRFVRGSVCLMMIVLFSLFDACPLSGVVAGTGMSCTLTHVPGTRRGYVRRSTCCPLVQVDMRSWNSRVVL